MKTLKALLITAAMLVWINSDVLLVEVGCHVIQCQVQR